MVQTSLSAWLNKGMSEENVDIPIASSSGTAQDGQLPTLTVPDLIKAQHNAEEEVHNSNATSTNENRIWISPTQKLPPNATMAAITVETLSSFRRMNTVLLPVPYPDSFYKEIINNKIASNISMVVLWTDTDSTQARVVSGIRCRLIEHPSPRSHDHDNKIPTLYISTITTLAPFRGHGLASALLRRVLARAIRDHGVTTVTAHMWEANEEAREWYAKQGFKELHFEPQYYRKLSPSGAYLLERRTGPSDLLENDEVPEEG